MERYTQQPTTQQPTRTRTTAVRPPLPPGSNPTSAGPIQGLPGPTPGASRLDALTSLAALAGTQAQGVHNPYFLQSLYGLSHPPLPTPSPAPGTQHTDAGPVPTPSPALNRTLSVPTGDQDADEEDNADL